MTDKNDMQNNAGTDVTENVKHRRFTAPAIAATVLFAVGLAFVLVAFLAGGDPFFLVLAFISGGAAIICLIVWLLKDIAKLRIKKKLTAETLVPVIGICLTCLTPLVYIPALSLILFFTGMVFVFPIAGLILGVTGIVISVKNSKPGLILSIISVSLPVIFLIVMFILAANDVAVISLM